MNRIVKVFAVACAMFQSTGSTLYAQDDEDRWQRVSTVELNVSLSHVAPDISAVVIQCEVYTRAPAAYGGKGYAVIYSQNSYEESEITQRAYEDIWMDRIALVAVDDLTSDGISLNVEVPIYGDQVNYNFWDKGQCGLRFTKANLGEADSDTYMGNLLPPLNCFDYSGDEFYRLASYCAAPDDSLTNADFYFQRDEYVLTPDSE